MVTFRSVARWSRPALMVGGAAVVAYLLFQIGLRAVWDSIQALGWRLLLVLFVPSATALILDTLGWRVLLREHDVPVVVVLRARLIGETVNMITPAASIGGEPLKAHLLRPYVPLAEGIGSVVVDKSTALVGQVLFLLAGLSLGAAILPLSHPLMRVMGVLLLVEIAAVSGFILIQIQGVFGGGGRIIVRMGIRRIERYQTGLNAVDRWLGRFYRERRRSMLAATLLHGAAWASGGLEIYLFLVFLNTDASPLTALVIEAFGSAIKFVSFAIPASLGALEGGHVAIFSALGLGGALGLSYMLIRRLREAVYVAVGLLWLAILRRPRVAPVAQQEAVR
jgi:uncharacterized protein (TIRG00374 family)